MNLFAILNVSFILICLFYIPIERKINKRHRIKIIIIFIFIFSFLMALRPIETKDTLGYVKGFYEIQPGHFYKISILQKDMGYEVGYINLVSIFKLFSNDYRVFFYLTALISTTFIIFGLKQLSNKITLASKDIYAPLLVLYISNFGLLYNGISVRAGLAMGFGIVAICFMIEKKYIKGLLLFLLAIIFQRSCFLFIVIYLIIRYVPILKIKTHYYTWLIIGIMIFTGLGNNLLDPIANFLNSLISKYQISGYASFLNEFDFEIGKRDLYLWLLYGIIILLSNSSKYYQKYLNVIMIGACVIALMSGVRAISRVYDMFYLFIVPTLGIIYYGKPTIKLRIKRLIVIGVIIANSILMLNLCFA